MKGKLLLVLVALSLHGCADDGPSAPSSPEASAGRGSTPPGFVGGAVSGRVVNAVTGAPVGGASIQVDGLGPASADSDGGFRIELPTGASVRVKVEAAGYWPRETGLRPAGGSVPSVTLSLLPDGNDFDLEFYDHVFRDVGEAGTHLWTSEPQFEVWEGVYDCTGFVEGAACEELTARDERAPAVFFQMVRGVIEADSRKYTDGQVLGANIATRSHPPGTVLSRSQFIEPAKITVALVSTRDDFSWGFWRYNNGGSMTGGHIHINIDHRSQRGVYSHELAHTLGFDHPQGLDRVPKSSIMRQGHGDEPTRFDVLHARILYGRPANSRTPDVDPMSFLLNGLRHPGVETGPEVTRSAR